MEKNQRIFLTLILSWIFASALADKCQCGPRCSGYKFENLCVRCCTSVMRRRSTDYSPSKQFEWKDSLGNGIDNQLLAEIVEASAELGKRTKNDGIANLKQRRRILNHALKMRPIGGNLAM